MSYKQLQKQFARQKLLSTIISFTSAEYAVYVIDATETICRTVDDMLPFLCSSNKMLSCLAHSTINVGQLRVVAASQARNISASTFLYEVLHIPRYEIQTYGRRAFTYAYAWNSLSAHLRPKLFGTH